MKIVAIFGVGLALAGCISESSTSLEIVEVPAQLESFAPQLSAAHGEIALSWLEKRGDEHVLRYARWEGESWGAARTVAGGRDWFANWADLPGVLPLTQGRWLAWWLQKSDASTYAYDVRLAWSNDGTAWREVGSPHDDGTPTEHGFVTAIEQPGGDISLAWLDGRNTLGSATHHAHGAGGMTLRHAMYSADGEKHSDMEIDALTCDCCQTDSALAGEELLVAYRDRDEHEIRDINVLRHEGGEWSAPVRVHADGWKIDGCPVNGPAIAAQGNRVAVAWFTAPDGNAEVRIAFSDDGARTFGAPLRVDGGNPLGRVDVVLAGERAYVVWMEAVDAGAEIRLRAITDNGAMEPPLTTMRTSAARSAGFPRIALLNEKELLLVWTDAADAVQKLRSARVNVR